MKTVILIFLFILVLILNSEQSDFTLGLENWRSEGDGQFSWEAAMGHPGGCFRVDDDATGDINRAYAPHKFLGDWSGMDETETLSADIYVVSSDVYIGGNYVFKIKGPGGSAKAIAGPTPPFYFWINYSVPISSSDWTIISGTWEAILADVRTLIVTAEYTDGNEFVRIDNVNLSSDPIDLPVQIGVISDFEEIGYDGWYYTNTISVNNQINGGNPSRFIRIDGNSYFTEGIAPAKFTGSWEFVEEQAAVLVDLKKFSPNPDWDEPQYLLKISGSGGTAKFPVPEDFDLSLTCWKTFLAFITESEWQMINGDWESLMDDVSEVRLALDFYDSDSSIGMDNFRINNEPPTSYFAADQTEIWLGEEISFTDYSTNSPDSWFWEFGDETTGFLPNPQHTYLEAGIFDVTLTATNIFGADSLTRASYITVVDPVPQELTISVSADSVHLFWNSISGANYYKIYGTDDPTAEFDSLDVSAESTWSSHISGIDKKFFIVSAVK